MICMTLLKLEQSPTQSPTAERSSRPVAAAPAALSLWQCFRRAWFTPQTFVAWLLLLLGVYIYRVSQAPVRPLEYVQVQLEDVAQEPSQPSEVVFTLINHQGLERSLFTHLSLPEAANARLHSLLSELRRLMLEQNAWPAALPAPEVFVIQDSSNPVAVLDFVLEQPLETAVATELQLLRALRSTLRRNGIDSMVILINGRPSKTFLGHVAIAQGL